MRTPLALLGFAKYERLLPRIFPDAVFFDLNDRQGESVWSSGQDPFGADGDKVSTPVVWSDMDKHLQRRQIADAQLQFRSPLRSRQSGQLGWLVVGFDAQASVPMSTATEPLRKSFLDAIAILQDELELQSECNALATELTERYEELNLVYATQDQVEGFEEGRAALEQLVHNCCDYLEVGLAVLIARDRGMLLQSTSPSHAPDDADALVRMLESRIYDYVQSQVSCLVVNEQSDDERQRLLGGRDENVLAMPIIDDHGTVVGVIGVASRQDQHTFSNGDRNLLEVMAKKASRIIHTHHDSLTGLLNRNGFESLMVSALSNARAGNAEHCLLHIDIDQLHVVNDLMGTQEGDALIRRVSKLIRSIVRDSDSIGRLGGDEFAVLLSNCETGKAYKVAEKIRGCIGKLSVISAARQLDVAASIGIAPVNSQSESIAARMAAAEIACNAAKEAGRNRTQMFEEDNTTLMRRGEEIEWIGRLQQALRDDSFVLHCQPVTPLDSRNEQHFEVLIRMLDEEGRIRAPGEFMPAAERYQLMPLIDRWVLRNALRTISFCSTKAADSVFCINLSGQSLAHAGFLEFIENEIEATGVRPAKICFEITETAAISNIDEALEFMSRLRDIGCRFALDDFGAGLSSFGYLKVLPVDYLKIDGSFIREVVSDKISYSMVRAICQIGKTMNLSIVAEFVGDEETRDVLRQIGIDYVQGFHIGKPAPFEQVLEHYEQSSKSISA